MSRDTTTAEHRKLMDQLAPDPAHGRLLGLLGTTYEMQPEFLETDFLPATLGLGAWDDRNWTSRIALEKQLAELEAVTILHDARPYRGRPRSLRVEIQPVALPTAGVLHAKVVLMVHERAVRLVVGSANLTEPGYRRNREVVAVLTADAGRPAEAQLISEAIQGVRSLLSDWTSIGSLELCELAEQRLTEWTENSDIDDQWFVWGGGESPIWKQFLNRWPREESVRRITIVSPFWSEEREGGPLTTFLSDLQSSNSLGGDAVLRLLTDAAPDQQATYKPQLPETFREFDATSLGVQAFAEAVDPRVPPKEVGLAGEFAGTRALHAKVVLIEGDETSLAFFGSANFTNRGWGFLPGRYQSNIEAGIVLRCQGDQREALTRLLPPTTGNPVALAGAAAGRLALPEASPEELPWPAFVRKVVLGPCTTQSETLELTVTVNPVGVKGEWEVQWLPQENSTGSALLKANSDSGSSDFPITLNDDSLGRIIRDQEVHICWWDCTEGRSFPVNVSAAARVALPIGPGSGRPAEQQLIAYYQGRITWEDLFPDPDSDQRKDPYDPHAREFNGVDTSLIQSYIIREFVEALPGISGDLSKAAKLSRAGMRLALLGVVSPLALARSIVDESNTGQRTPTAAGFQLVEILRCLDVACHYETGPSFHEDWLQLLGETREAIVAMLQQLQTQFPGVLSEEFRRYADSLQKHQFACGES